MISKRSDKQWFRFKVGAGWTPPLARYVSRNDLTIGGRSLEKQEIKKYESSPFVFVYKPDNST